MASFGCPTVLSRRTIFTSYIPTHCLQSKGARLATPSNFTLKRLIRSSGNKTLRTTSYRLMPLSCPHRHAAIMNDLICISLLAFILTNCRLCTYTFFPSCIAGRSFRKESGIVPAISSCIFSRHPSVTHVPSSSSLLPPPPTHIPRPLVCLFAPSVAKKI